MPSARNSSSLQPLCESIEKTIADLYAAPQELLDKFEEIVSKK